MTDKSYQNTKKLIKKQLLLYLSDDIEDMLNQYNEIIIDEELRTYISEITHLL